MVRQPVSVTSWRSLILKLTTAWCDAAGARPAGARSAPPQAVPTDVHLSAGWLAVAYASAAGSVADSDMHLLVSMGYSTGAGGATTDGRGSEAAGAMIGGRGSHAYPSGGSTPALTCTP